MNKEVNIPDFKNLLPKFNEIKNRFDNIKNKSCSGFSRYFIIEREIPGKFTWLKRLNLDSKKNLDILDISGGIYLFGWLCKQFGHNVVTTDRSTSNKEFNDIRSDLIKLFDLEYKELPIVPFKLLDINDKFDIITAFGTAFQTNWNSDQMTFFLNNISELLKDEKSIFLIQCNRSGVPLIRNSIDKKLIKLKLIKTNLHTLPYFMFTKG